MKRAIITGATSGIGKEMAIQLHRRGWELVLTGRNAAVLQRMAKKCGSGTRYIALDLAERDAPQKLYDFCRGMRIDMLINNAGFGAFGTFTESSLEQELSMVDVNIRAVHILTKLFLRDFVKRDAGIILNVASIAAFAPGPLMATYYASKSYVLRLTLAIREELRRSGSHVTVSVLCPGPVATEFSRRAGVNFAIRPADVHEVAYCGLSGALAGRSVILPKLSVKLGALGAGLCPQEIAAAFVYLIQRRRKPRD